MSVISKTQLQRQAEQLVTFVNMAPSPFHAIDVCRNWLRGADFTELKEKKSWSGALKPNGKYFFTRNGSTIVAFAVGGKFRPGNGMSIVAAHSDSPCLKLKPVSKKKSSGMLQVGVQLYGGGLWHTWFDRDLSVAGRVMVRDDNGGYVSRLVTIKEPIMSIPSLAIHLDRTANEAFKFNKEVHLTPVLATVSKAVNNESNSETEDKFAHHPVLLERIAKQLDVKVGDIADFELCLYDTQKAVIGGICNELIYGARLDNLNSSYCAIEALINSVHEDLTDDTNVRMVALFDNEEVGSNTANGADSALLESTIRRIQASCEGAGQTAFEETIAKSFLVSSDVAHAVHPNYSEKHEENHRPEMQKGPTIKVNANQRYATTAATSTILKEIASRNSIPLQEFVIRNDSSCGSTIGPLLSAQLGMRTIDIGNPILAMHSIREVCGADDVALMVKLFERFFAEFAELDAKVQVD
ncbi:aspartyl aminopeptidase [Coemansia reversa NRRL 1564]|uniref:aspartyl aminopeptidase n=1 Tax=Coemansia reversa (strain ATCC 12441 / NRRL 1564) TaxID=763665 RepID=A0A2G5BJT9_COERN|nr:aspartyl aminopeptidase [Coemansia reversa NRRL 1564]|eukprot:PIA19276.1 aspartyl aminopeptidase [Coemansia reversa NRRL 1564]